MSADLEIDPFDYSRDLRRAMADSELERLTDGSEVSDAGRLAAYRLARTLGRCHLFGVPINKDTHSTLRKTVAIAAGSQFVHQLGEWTERVSDLPERWDNAVDATEAEDLCGGLLAARMDAWAIWIAIDKSYEYHLESNMSEMEPFHSAIDDAVRALERFDSELRNQSSLLSTICDTYLLRNWRESLADEYREFLPWWLNGTLEETAKQDYEEMIDTLPGVDAWAQMRERVIDSPSGEQFKERTKSLFSGFFNDVAISDKKKAETLKVWKGRKESGFWNVLIDRYMGRLSTPISPQGIEKKPQGLVEWNTEVKGNLFQLVSREFNRTERLIIILHYYEDLTMKEIADALDLNESQVSQMHIDLVLRMQKFMESGGGLTAKELSDKFDLNEEFAIAAGGNDDVPLQAEASSETGKESLSENDKDMVLRFFDLN